jgi:hypothetical protein
MNERTGESAGRQSSVRIGAILAVAVAVGFVVWLVVRERDDGSASTSGTTTQTTTGGSAVGPVAASVARLRALASTAGHPVYWAGPKEGTTYELTRTSGGRIYVRYLPRGVPVGIRSATFTIVGTYPVANALKVLKDLAKKPGERQLSAPADGFAVYEQSHPTNVYVAYPDSNLQVEVFDPSPRRARRLVTSGAVAPVG